MTSDHLLNISEAAKATGKSIPTIRAYLAEGKLPNAKAVAKGKSKSWRIPLTDLVAAGLLDKVETSTASAQPSNGELEQLRVEVAQLRERLEGKDREIARLEQARADLIAAYAPRIETAERQSQRRKYWFSRG